VKNEVSKEISIFIKDYYSSDKHDNNLDFLNNPNFNIMCNVEDNKTFVSCNIKIDVDVLFYEYDSISNNINLLYKTISSFDNNSFWYSTAKKLKELKGLRVEIRKDDNLLKEEYFDFTISKDEYIWNYANVKQQVLVLHSEVGIGDNLAATPIIKKMSEVYEQKVIIVTYIPSAFINNPYIGEIIPIKNNLHQILGQFNADKYDIHNLFLLMGANWRLVDHKQICAYNVGFQLKSNELDMEFYPDPFEPIDNLPERYICINPSETEPERTWGYKNWQEFIDKIQEYIPVVAIGKETYLDANLVKKFSNITIKNGLNLLNHPSQNTLSQAYHIISKSETFVTMNNGLYILALCNLDTHVTEISTSWNTYFYRTRKGIENYNLDYIRGGCQVECLANPKMSIKITGTTQILKSGICYLNKPTYECHPTSDQVFKSVLKRIL
jgi:hypothetical protein